MKVLKWLLIIIAVLVGLFVVCGLILSNEFEVTREVVVNAPADKVYPLLNDLKRWDEWAPWKDEDPTIVVTYGEITSGHGAFHSWTGNSGNGELRLTKSDPATGIEYSMAFIMSEDQKMPSTGSMRLEPASGGTKVIWNWKGSMPVPVLGAYGAMMMDVGVGPMFEKGLAKLKVAAER